MGDGPRHGKSFNVWVTDPATGELARVTTLPLLELWLGTDDGRLRRWYLDHKRAQHEAISGHDVAALPASLELPLRERLGLGPEPLDEQWIPIGEDPR